MIDYNFCNVEHISAHRIGNKNNEDTFAPCEFELEIPDNDFKELLCRYFLGSFKIEEFFNFTFSNNEFELNPLHKYAASLFSDSLPFHENSIKIAQYLFDVSNHPNIKTGDLFVVHFTNLKIGSEPQEALGLFKAENKQPFLTIDHEDGNVSVNYEKGLSIEKLDKGCIILNKSKNEGYKILIVDRSNKSEEAHYWKNLFLNIKPCSDDFHHTKAFLNLTKTYVSEKLEEDFEIDKTDKIDILNRSVAYFKSHEEFNKEEFEEEVFQSEEVISSFRSFDQNYRTENELVIEDEFEISSQAVKKQSRFFKSILKLDKNFHVYIHGDKSLIEKGVEDDGRKFYKIYYEKED